MTEYELFEKLRPRFPKQEYALLPQVPDATGTGKTRTCDALALGLWPSRGIHLHGFELKQHRYDWIRELKDPAKADGIAQFCNFWWVVTAGEFVEVDELPEGWGLLEFKESRGQLFQKRKAAFRKRIKELDITFLAGILRRAQEVVTPQGVIDEARAKAFEEGQQQQANRNKYESGEYEKLKKLFADFKRTSKIDISHWSNGAEVGAAVNLVLHGSVERQKKDLLQTARQIIKDLEETTAQNGNGS